MKKLVMTLVATSVLTANVAMAETKVYGKINLSVNQTQVEVDGTDTQDNFELVSHASRLGFKGDAEIIEGLTALAKIEYEVAADGDRFKSKNANTSNDSPFKARNVYVGVEGGWGQALAGRKDTPLKLLGKKADQFNDYKMGDIKAVVEGENRENNMIQYASPTMAGFKIIAATVLQEEDGVNSDEDSGLADSYSVVVDYKISDFSVGLGHDTNVDGLDVNRVAADWKIAGFKFGALVQLSELNDSTSVSDETAYVVSASYKLDSWKFKAQYGAATIDVNRDDDDKKSMAVIGVDYKLAKTTKVYGYYAMNDETIYSKVSDAVGSTPAIYADVEEKGNTFGLGLEHKF